MKCFTRQSIVLAFVLTVSAILFTGVAGRAESVQEPAKTKFAAIESITASGEGEATELVVRLSSPATYTSYKTTTPLRLVIDLSQTTQGAITAPIVINKGNIKNVTVSRFDTDAGTLTRINIELVNDLDAIISASPAQPGELHISFPVQHTLPAVTNTETVTPPAADKAVEVSEKNPASITTPVPDAAKEAAAEPASRAVPEVGAKLQPVVPPTGVATHALKAIAVKDGAIFLAIDGGPEDFKTFRLNKPERYVIDLFGVTSILPSRFIPLNADSVASARIGLYPDKTRVVLDGVNGSFPEATAVKTDEGIRVALGSTSGPTTLPLVTAGAEKTVNEPAPQKAPVKAEIKPSAPVVTEPLPQSSVPAPSPTHKTELRMTAGPAMVEMIDFQVIDNVSRVSVKVSGDVTVEQPVKTAGFVTLTIHEASLPKRLQRSLDAEAFVSPVLRVTPFMVKTRKGTDTKVRIALRVDAPYEFRRNGDMLFVDFKTPEGLIAGKPELEAAHPRRPAAKEADLNSELTSAPDFSTKSGELVKHYKGRKVTLEFADADVRKIFQLLSEVSNKNFVLGDDVTGTISIKLVNVPWDQALDIILDTKGLDKREEGNIIIIKGKGKFKSQAEEEQEVKKALTRSIELKTETFNINYADIATISSQFNGLKSERGVISQDSRTNKVIVKDIPQALDDMRKLLQQLDVPEKQVMIEARIVEATSTFTRSLGVNWGIHYRDASASFLGMNSVDTTFGGAVSTIPSTSGASSNSGTATGISFGSLASNIQLDMRLNAAATVGLVKIVSTPKVATLNNKTAKITQGQQIPYTSSTSDKVETKFVEAALALEVTPHINSNGTISMKIDAKNDSPGSVPTGSTAPSINKKQATTEMLLRDGETTVIGGIYVDNDTESDEGVPFLMDIPFLGKFFKSNSKSKTKTELLIFITPRILSTI
ncbi:type IV pilus secretin family protein [Geobacter sp. AOG2]|uniref:type IV pilus secretin family protein n=1 Tax=Geobacter sp. AOG2 TaxID=1566347 RepID=UPI001CC5B837|nr:type IV pilus secretin family protein [Geobacter sp. AOG2]GFE61523.1 pilus modification protein PilQ [Geobacter sp. AOG2]